MSHETCEGCDKPMAQCDCDVCVDCHERFIDGEDQPCTFACAGCGQVVCESCASNSRCASCDVDFMSGESK